MIIYDAYLSTSYSLVWCVRAVYSVASSLVCVCVGGEDHTAFWLTEDRGCEQKDGAATQIVRDLGRGAEGRRQRCVCVFNG